MPNRRSSTYLELATHRFFSSTGAWCCVKSALRFAADGKFRVDWIDCHNRKVALYFRVALRAEGVEFFEGWLRWLQRRGQLLLVAENLIC